MKNKDNPHLVTVINKTKNTFTQYIVTNNKWVKIKEKNNAILQRN